MVTNHLLTGMILQVNGHSSYATNEMQIQEAV